MHDRPHPRPRRAGHAPRRRLRRTGTVALLLSLALVAVACKPDSTGVAPVRGATGVLIGIDKANSHGGTMGVDIMLGPDEYNPCHLQFDDQDGSPYNDRYYGACQDSALGRNSYYRHMTYGQGGHELNGVAITGTDANRCGGQGWCPDQSGTLTHGWSDKATAWALEFYPSSGTEGGVRITGRFDQPALYGFMWSGAVGAMNPVVEGDPGTFRLTGSIFGGPWADRRFQIEAFQMPPWTKTTSTGWPEEGFAVVPNSGTSFSGWPMPSGHYKVYVRDLATGGGTIVFRDLGPGSRIDIVPWLPCMGLAGGLDLNTEQPAC